MLIFTRAFTLAALERALKTAAQVAILAIIGTGAAAAADAQINAFTVDWLAVLGFAVGGFVLSYLTSISSARLGKWEGPSLVDEAIVSDEVDMDFEWEDE